MRTLTAMFDNRAEAEVARDRLASAGVSNDNVTILDQSSLGETGTMAATRSGEAGSTRSTDARGTSDGRSIWEGFKSLFSDDHASYEEGIRRGGYLLTAQVDDAQVDRAIDILDDDGTVDLDERTSTWRNEGWSGDRNEGLTGADGNARASAAGGIGSALHAGVDKPTGDDRDGHDRGGMNRDHLDRDNVDRDNLNRDNLDGDNLDRDTLSDAGETRIPVVEEQLRVGKREVARGGVRVRSYIVEEPARGSVRLREEHVTVDRRPVTGDTNANAGDLLRERTIEVTETAEEVVIDKQAHVREEVVIGKTVDERVQEVEETVRRTQVDVRQLNGADRTDRNGDVRTAGDGDLLSDRDRDPARR